MNAIFYHFSKRKNSTAVPANGETKTIFLKDDCSVLNPSISLNMIDRPTYNYCRLFERYYFCSDWTWSGRLWHCNLTEDYLASWKDEILASRAYVLYSSSAGSKNITDNRLTLQHNYTFNQGNAVPDFYSASGVYILGVVSDMSSSAGGFLACYLMTENQLSSLADALVGQSALDWIKEWGYKPFDSIAFCNWLPIAASAFNTTRVADINIGGYKTGISGNLINNKLYAPSIDVPIPWNRIPNTFKRCSPYCTMSLYLPFVGVVPLNPDLLKDFDSVHIQTTIDVTLGNIVYTIAAGNKILATYGGSAGASIPVSSQSQGSFGGVLGGVMVTIGGIAAAVASGGLTLGAAGAIAGGIGSTASSARTETQINGALSSRAGANNLVFRILVTYAEHDDGIVNTVMGQPTMKAMQLSSLSGYVQTNGASVQAQALEPELTAVNALLDSGIYIE